MVSWGWVMLAEEEAEWRNDAEGKEWCDEGMESGQEAEADDGGTEAG